MISTVIEFMIETITVIVVPTLGLFFMFFVLWATLSMPLGFTIGAHKWAPCTSNKRIVHYNYLYRYGCEFGRWLFQEELEK